MGGYVVILALAVSRMQYEFYPQFVLSTALSTGTRGCRQFRHAARVNSVLDAQAGVISVAQAQRHLSPKAIRHLYPCLLTDMRADRYDI